MAPIAASAQAVQVSAGYTQLTSANAIMLRSLSDNLTSPFYKVFSEADHSQSSGLFAEVVGNVTRHAGIVGHMSVNSTTSNLSFYSARADVTAYTVLGGPRLSSRCCRSVVPFGQVLLGIVHTTADVKFPAIQGVDRVLVAETIVPYRDNYWAFTVGGGADVRIGAPIGLHLAADLMRTSRPHQNKNFEWTPRVRVGLTVPMR